MVASENPIMLSHNILDRAYSLTANEFHVNHAVEKLRDGNRHTWWEAPATAAQSIDIFAENKVKNGNFEVDISCWGDIAAGGGAGSLTHETAAPIAGDGDLKINATAANNGAQVYAAYQHKPILLKAGRTYRIMLRGDAEGGAPKNARIGFAKVGGVEDTDFYTDFAIQNAGSAHEHDVTPIVDTWVNPYIRMLEIAIIHFDEIYVGELRDIDTLIIDKGHNLSGATIEVKYSDDSIPTWIVHDIQAWYNNAPIYRTFAPHKALAWQINITVDPLYAAVERAKVPILFLGQRWEINKNRVNFYDPHEERRLEHELISDRGILQRTPRYNQRKYRTTLQPFETSDYDDIVKFFEDTQNGLKPFFFIPKPISDINDILFMRMKTGRSAPYFAPNQIRSWDLNLDEVVGARRV